MWAFLEDRSDWDEFNGDSELERGRFWVRSKERWKVCDLRRTDAKGHSESYAPPCLDRKIDTLSQNRRRTKAEKTKRNKREYVKPT